MLPRSVWLLGVNGAKYFQSCFPPTCLIWWCEGSKNCGEKFWTSHKVYLSLYWSDCDSVGGYCVVQFIENKRLQMMEMALCWVLAFITRDFPFSSGGWCGQILSLHSLQNTKSGLVHAGWLAGSSVLWLLCTIKNHGTTIIYQRECRSRREGFKRKHFLVLFLLNVPISLVIDLHRINIKRSQSTIQLS